MVTGPLVPASGPSRNVRPENDAHRSPPGGVLDPRNPRGIPSGPTASPSVPRPCLAAPLDALSGRPSRERPLMQQRRLGDSDLHVSSIALGSWLTYSGGIGRERTEACTRAAFDSGVTFFDTANVYGRGAAERAWGEILSGYPRDSFTLATKVYFPMGPRDRGLSRTQIHKQIDASLDRLGTDYVDLYQCHRYDDATQLEETMRALTEVVEAGKARWIGFSEWPPDRIQAALDMPGVAKFVSSQPQYSALWRAPEAEVIPLCEPNGMSQVVWSPLAQGVLTGKYRA